MCQPKMSTEFMAERVLTKNNAFSQHILILKAETLRHSSESRRNHAPLVFLDQRETQVFSIYSLFCGNLW